jgi:hypothetical protein
MRKIFGICIIILGGATIALGIFLISLSHKLDDVIRSASIIAMGVATAMIGWGIIKKRRIRDLLESLFLSWP